MRFFSVEEAYPEILGASCWWVYSLLRGVAECHPSRITETPTRGRGATTALECALDLQVDCIGMVNSRILLGLHSTQEG